MSSSAIIWVCLIRSLSAIAAIAGAVFLSYHGKEGWGWLVVVALALGTYSLSAK
jgi:hypothetical protein